MPKTSWKSLALLGLTCSGLILTHAEQASAFGWWREEFLGRTTSSDRTAYFKSIGRPNMIPAIPGWGDADRICRWKYQNSKAYGRSANPAFIGSWDINCYHSVWRWWGK